MAVAFFFGLLHGLGFADGLLEVMHAMPVSLIWYAILGFSLGVEAGNQLVLLPLFGGLWYLRESKGLSRSINFRRYASGAVCWNMLLFFRLVFFFLIILKHHQFNHHDISTKLVTKKISCGCCNRQRQHRNAVKSFGRMDL